MWKKIKSFIQQLLNNFNRHQVLTLSAALAFYTALSLAPLLLITLSVVGLLGGKSQLHLLEQIRSVLGDPASAAVTTVIDNAQQRPHLGSLAGIAGIVILLFSASSVFAQLQFSLNTIWDCQTQTSASWWVLIRRRLLSIGMVISFGFLALVSLLVSAVLSYVLTNDGEIWQIVNLLVTLMVFTIAFAMIFKFLPDANIPWKDSLYGGLTTAVLFALGKSLIGIYLGHSAIGSAYGAAGSLIVLLAWVYYSAIIVFTGAEITNVTTTRRHKSKDGVPMTKTPFSVHG
ncbi:MAG: YihY/virulence factor BrkB family protein [Burkholderiales bacterium]